MSTGVPVEFVLRASVSKSIETGTPSSRSTKLFMYTMRLETLDMSDCRSCCAADADADLSIIGKDSKIQDSSHVETWYPKCQAASTLKQRHSSGQPYVAGATPESRGCDALATWHWATSTSTPLAVLYGVASVSTSQIVTINRLLGPAKFP